MENIKKEYSSVKKETINIFTKELRKENKTLFEKLWKRPKKTYKMIQNHISESREKQQEEFLLIIKENLIEIANQLVVSKEIKEEK